jgi:protein-ribulosamine 3-kinase
MNSNDWQSVQQMLTANAGHPIGRLEANPVSGGDINRAYRLSDGQHYFFIKTNSQKCLPMFEAEMLGLQTIRCSNSIRVPQAIGCGIAGTEAFIAMEYLELSGRPDPTRLAQQLASMHLNTLDQYGFAIDNTIGSTPQTNSFSDDWVGFWQQQRLGYQLSLAKIKGYGTQLFDAGMRLNEQLGHFFSDYTPLASLLHGDLWSGNQGADAEGNPVIYDPACYYGDHETDLAMMELFGSPGKRFFEVYKEFFPIDPGYNQRRELYNLYHILNHANLFGGSYFSQAERMINKLLAQV